MSAVLTTPTLKKNPLSPKGHGRVLFAGPPGVRRRPGREFATQRRDDVAARADLAQRATATSVLDF